MEEAAKGCGGEGHDEDECLEEAVKKHCRRCGGENHDEDECLEAGRAHTARVCVGEEAKDEAAEGKASESELGREAGEGRVGGASNVSEE